MNYGQFRVITAIALLVVNLLSACSRSNVNSTVNPGKTGTVIESEIKVSAEVDAAEPAVAADKEGNTYVVFVEHGGKSTADVFSQKHDKNLKPVGAKVRVSTDGLAKTWRGDPPTVAVGPDGTLFVGWTRFLTVGHGTDLVISASRDGGRSFDAPVKVNDDSEPASHGMHSLAVGNDGRVYAPWLDERNVKTSPHMARVTVDRDRSALPEGYEFVPAHHTDNSNAKPAQTPNPAAEAAEPNSEVFFSFSTDGAKTFAANKKIAADVCPCCKTSMLAAADGRVYVSWRQVLPGDLRHIAVTSTADGGSTFSERSIVSDDQWRLHACPVSGAALAYADGGNLSVTWYTAGDAGQAGIYSAESSDGGKSFDPRRLMSFDAGPTTPIAFSGKQVSMFATNDREIVVADGQGTAGRIENATLPAAAASSDRIVAAFVRPEGEGRSVWLTRMHRE